MNTKIFKENHVPLFQKCPIISGWLHCRPIIPYIKPFGERFDPSQLPYFKYRRAVAELETERGVYLEVYNIAYVMVGGWWYTGNHQNI